MDASNEKMNMYFRWGLIAASVLLLPRVLMAAAMATPLGVSLSLTDVQFTYNPFAANLSAAAGAVGNSPALPLPNNGIYQETLAGDYSIALNLPPLDQPELWFVHFLLTYDGQPLLGNTYTTDAPISIIGAYDYLLSVAPAPGLIKIAVNVLTHRPMLDTGGLLDYVYDFAPSDLDSGTFAVGSKEDLATLFGNEAAVLPSSALLSLSVVVDAVPEPSAILLFSAGLFALAFVRRAKLGHIRNGETESVAAI
jgi:hypothetical protein